MTDRGKILSFPDAAAVEAEAAVWVARFDAGEVSAQDQAAFQAWLGRSALHRQAIAEYGSLWSEFDALALLADAGAVKQQAGMREGQPAALKKTWPRLAACAAAAAVIAVAGGAALFYASPGVTPGAVPKAASQVAQAQPHPPAGLFYETAVGDHKQIVLADGTTVSLNTNSRLDVRFSGNRRDIYLIRGEAYFEVVHDKARPFTVYASNYAVRDIGTAFDVHLAAPGRVEVGVTKGSVAVAPVHDGQDPGAAASPDVIVAGHRVVLDKTIEPVQRVSSIAMGRKLAWRQGELIYTGQPLQDVLADISRYSDIKIELADPAVANLPVGGAFRTDQIEAIFAALESNFGIHAQWIDPRHVRFTAGGAKQTIRN